MSTVIEPTPPTPPAADPWQIGWRDVFHRLPDGTLAHEQIPLTLEDALHPQEGDCIVESDLHTWLRGYLFSVFRSRLAGDPQALVLSDTPVYWDHPALEHHAPDTSVIFGVKRQKIVWSSFHVRDEGTRPYAVVELVSPNTRSNDVDKKLYEYHLAEVKFYFIFDKEHEEDPWTLQGYEWAPGGYVALTADAAGRIWFDAVGLWLAAEGHDIVCYDGKTNERIDILVENRERVEQIRTDLVAATNLAEAERQRAEDERQRAEDERQRAKDERKRAEDEKQRAENERQRADGERKHAEHEKQRAENERKRAEDEKQRAEDEKLRAEDEKQRAEDERKRAEDEKLRAEVERKGREAAEARVKDLEAELARLRGQ